MKHSLLIIALLVSTSLIAKPYCPEPLLNADGKKCLPSEEGCLKTMDDLMVLLVGSDECGQQLPENPCLYEAVKDEKGGFTLMCGPTFDDGKTE